MATLELVSFLSSCLFIGVTIAYVGWDTFKSWRK